MVIEPFNYFFRIVCSIVLFGFPPLCAKAAVVYVNADASGANNGTSWVNAFNDLQGALAASNFGDEIWVAQGTYKPTAGTDRAKSFVLAAGVKHYGGFTGTEATATQRNWTTNITILSGDIGVVGNISDNSEHVVVGGFQSTLDGFTVIGGNANVFPSNRGGGMLNDSVSPIITNCNFIANSASLGGGMYNNLASPTITNCTFSGNSASNIGGGGGMYNSSSSPILANCIFSGNSATGNPGRGGGLSGANASPTVINSVFIGNSANNGGGMSRNGTLFNCIFSGNTAQNDGGGLEGAATVINCTFSGNLVTGNNSGGGGMSGSGILTNCTFSGNSANGSGGEGGGLYISNATTMTNCVFWQNTATLGPEIYKSSGNPIIRNCNIRGSGGSGVGWNTALGIDGGGNIMADPKYADSTHPAGADGIWRTSDDGLRLLANSPCIDKGIPTGAPATDILGNPRIGLPDIGAYEAKGKSNALDWIPYH